VLPGETGWIFEADNVPALTEVLSEALADPKRLQAMGQKALAHIQRFSYAVTTAGLRKALTQVLGNR